MRSAVRREPRLSRASSNIRRAEFRMSVLTDIKNRGVRDKFFLYL